MIDLKQIFSMLESSKIMLQFPLWQLRSIINLAIQQFLTKTKSMTKIDPKLKEYDITICMNFPPPFLCVYTPHHTTHKEKQKHSE